jgi:hypothetical protein
MELYTIVYFSKLVATNAKLARACTWYNEKYRDTNDCYVCENPSTREFDTHINDFPIGAILCQRCFMSGFLHKYIGYEISPGAFLVDIGWDACKHCYRARKLCWWVDIPYIDRMEPRCEEFIDLNMKECVDECMREMKYIS